MHTFSHASVTPKTITTFSPKSLLVFSWATQSMDLISRYDGEATCRLPKSTVGHMLIDYAIV
eukprot:SAG31_NODE_44659_length_262_cov_0.595092_1_plen_61_part_10